MKTLTQPANDLLTKLKRQDVDYTTLDNAVYQELYGAGFALVHFSSTGNRAFATDRGKAAK